MKMIGIKCFRNSNFLKNGYTKGSIKVRTKNKSSFSNQEPNNIHKDLEKNYFENLGPTFNSHLTWGLCFRNNPCSILTIQKTSKETIARFKRENATC